jgi:hypothetical protein
MLRLQQYQTTPHPTRKRILLDSLVLSRSRGFRGAVLQFGQCNSGNTDIPDLEGAEPLQHDLRLLLDDVDADIGIQHHLHQKGFFLFSNRSCFLPPFIKSSETYLGCRRAAPRTSCKGEAPERPPSLRSLYFATFQLELLGNPNSLAITAAKDFCRLL